MIYIPMLKTRKEELKVLKVMKEHYSDKIIPLIEVIREIYKPNYLTDENGEFIKEKRNTQFRKIKCVPTEQDVITLQRFNEMVEGHKLFIDYFRFSLSKYGKNINFKSAELAINLNNDYQLYKDKVLSAAQYNNMIPVISVKPGFDIPKNELKSFVTQLQNKTEQMALRIMEEWIDEYKDIISDLLRYHGDYCGLRDVMPLNNKSNGKGAALALLYDFTENVFYSYCNHDTSLGMKGYLDIIPLIKEDEMKLNRDGDCPGFMRIEQIPNTHTGSWSTWHYINAVRYIHQTSKYLKK